MLDWLEDSRNGLLPVAGGLLNQTACFVDALRFVRAEESRWRVKLKLPNHG